MRRLTLTVMVPENDSPDSRQAWYHLTEASNQIAALGGDINLLSETLQFRQPEQPQLVMTEESIYKTMLAISDAGLDDTSARMILEKFKAHGLVVLEKP